MQRDKNITLEVCS